MSNSTTEAMVNWLADMGYRASTRPPSTMPTEFVTVERTAGYVENLIDHPTFAVQAWARTEDRAEAMAVDIKSAATFGEPPEGFASLRVDAGEYSYWDESTGMPRYQLVIVGTAHI